MCFLLLAWHANALQSESEEKNFSNFEGLYAVTVSFWNDTPTSQWFLNLSKNSRNPAYICLFKVIIETLKNMFKVQNKNTRTKTIHKQPNLCKAESWCFYYEFWTYFTPTFSVSIVDFEQGNVRGECFSVVFVLTLITINNFQEKNSDLLRINKH